MLSVYTQGVVPWGNLGAIDIIRVLEAVRVQALGQTVPELLGVVGTGLGHPLEPENQPEIKKNNFEILAQEFLLEK